MIAHDDIGDRAILGHHRERGHDFHLEGLGGHAPRIAEQRAAPAALLDRGPDVIVGHFGPVDASRHSVRARCRPARAVAMASATFGIIVAHEPHS